MKKWVCKVCGYVHEGEHAPEQCPTRKVGPEKFEELKGDVKLAAEHEYGIYAKTVKNNLDAIHDTVHEMARDEARHGKALKGLLERYFG